MSSIISLDHEIVELPDTVGVLWVCQTSQRNWVTIKVNYGYLRKYLLGWQLYVNGGEDLAGAGLVAALPARLARALSSGPARGLPGGPARVLPWRAIVPGKDLAGGLVGFLGKNPVEDRCLPILI